MYEDEAGLGKNSDVMVHVPVVLCAQTFCDMCLEGETPCLQDLWKEKKGFHGKECVQDFASFLQVWRRHRSKLNFTGENRFVRQYEQIDGGRPGDRLYGNLVFAHNAGRFDHHFVFHEMNKSYKPSSIIKQGNGFITVAYTKSGKNNPSQL